MSAADDQAAWVFHNLETGTIDGVGADSWLLDVDTLTADELRHLHDADAIGWFDTGADEIVRRRGVAVSEVLDVVEWFGRNGFASFDVLRGAALAVAGSSASPVSVLDQVRAALAERVRVALLMLAEITAERLDAAAAADWLEVLGTRPDGLRLILAELAEGVTA